MIFGHGVKLAGATKEALDFVEKNGIPFLVSWGAFDICRTDHPLRLGSPGVYGDRYANYAIQNADLLISIGSRLDSRQIGGNAALFSKHSKKIMVDTDDHEITKMGEKGINIDFRINEVASNKKENTVYVWHWHKSLNTTFDLEFEQNVVTRFMFNEAGKVTVRSDLSEERLVQSQLGFSVSR